MKNIQSTVKMRYANIALWTLQVLLALWTMTGAIYMITNYQDLAREWVLNAFPKPVWIVLGVLQVLLAIGLIIPGAWSMKKKLNSISAASLSVISLMGIALYTAYSGFSGMLWGAVPAILLAFVAYWRKN